MNALEYASTPTLVVISGPGGFGKTTAAHAIARAVGCPAICRDEIKEGMVHATPAFRSGWPADPLTQRTYPTFFDVLGLLLGRGVTVVAEASFQDKLWRAGLERLDRLAKLRVVQCVTDPAIAHARSIRRYGENPVRRAHADALASHGPDDALERYHSFDRLAYPAPAITVDTTDGYDPAIEEVVAFIDS